MLNPVISRFGIRRGHVGRRALHAISHRHASQASTSRSSSLSDPLDYLPDIPTDDLPIISTSESQVAVGWNPQTWSRFHNIWLRDHCRCPACFHALTKQRLVDTFEIPKDIKPLRVDSKPNGLEITWPAAQPHISTYPWSWLRHNSYDPVMRQKDSSDEKILWGSKIVQAPPTVAHQEVMGSDQGLFKWLSNIERFGFSFVTGVPPTPEATESLSERIGLIRETQYGKFWDFTSDLAKGDTAYTTIALEAHTDNTYFTDPCGIQLFHLLSHEGGGGGESLLVDGYYVASILKELYPDAYQILSTVTVPAHAAGEPSAIYQPTPVNGYPVLKQDRHSGELIQVRWNNDDRSVMNHLEPHQVEGWYDAIRTWNDFLRSPDSEYLVQLQPGTVVAIDNHRVLHGRSAFTGARRMCGAYIGVDEYKSKLAVLKEQFAPHSVLLATNQLNGTVHNNRNIWNPAL